MQHLDPVRVSFTASSPLIALPPGSQSLVTKGNALCVWVAVGVCVCVCVCVGVHGYFEHLGSFKVLHRWR